MFLAKRPRRPIMRTTSTSKLSLKDVAEGHQQSDGDLQQRRPQSPAVMGMKRFAMINSYNSNSAHGIPQQYQHHYEHQQGPFDGFDPGKHLSMAPPRNSRGRSADYAMESAQHLRVCSLCKQRLGPGRETFMYRGEVAFCSLECRQQRMNQAERKEKCMLAYMNREPPQSTA